MRKQLNLKQSDIAAFCGIDRVSVSGWENGYAPSAKNLQNLAKLFQVEPEWILYGESAGVNATATEQGNTNAIKPLNPPRFIEVKLYGETLNDFEYYNLAMSALQKDKIPSQFVSCFELQTGNLDPVMPPKSILAVDLRNTKVQDGSVYVIDQQGMIRANRLFRLPGNGLRLQSYNKDYPDEIIANTVESNLKIIGRVFWSCSNR